MSNGSSRGAIAAALEFIAGAIDSGGKTRKDLLASALAANTVGAKRQILAKLTSDEI